MIYLFFAQFYMKIIFLEKHDLHAERRSPDFKNTFKPETINF